MKQFEITWKKNEKYNAKITRTNKITADSAQNAVQLFMRQFGNLKKNTIIEIQEKDIKGNNIGEPIRPD